jgi:hypothetical protein
MFLVRSVLINVLALTKVDRLDGPEKSLSEDLLRRYSIAPQPFSTQNPVKPRKRVT